MEWRNTSVEFGLLAKTLHWLVAAGLFTLFYLGLEQAGLERGPEKTELRFIHGSIAMIVLLLMTIRLAWRALNDVPGHPAGTPVWQRMTASIVHRGLYLVVFLQLLSGSMTVATAGQPLPFFGIFSIPLPVAEDHDSHEFWEEVHEFAWTILAILIVVHVLAALYNHYVLKNAVLRRMTIGLG